VGDPNAAPFQLSMELVGAIHSIGITERRGRFLKRSLVLPIVSQGFANISLKHTAVYTLINSTAVTNPSGATSHHDPSCSWPPVFDGELPLIDQGRQDGKGQTDR
jgi:hypothetical protein